MQVDTRIVLIAIVGLDGFATRELPPEVGSNFFLPPLMVCYTAADPAKNQVWLKISDGDFGQTSATCNLTLQQPSGIWLARVRGGFPGWTVAFVVVY